MSPEPLVSLYVLINPIDNLIFYVGISVNPKQRFVQHLKANNRAYKTNPLKAKLIRKIKKAGLKPIMAIVDELPELMIAQAERDWIAFLRKSFALTNISPGGSSVSEETRKKLSEARTGVAMDVATKLKIAKGMKGNGNSVGYKQSEEHKRKMSESQKKRLALKKAA